MGVKKVAWNSWRYTSTSTQAEEEVVCRLSNTILQFRNTFEMNSSSAHCYSELCYNLSAD